MKIWDSVYIYTTLVKLEKNSINFVSVLATLHLISFDKVRRNYIKPTT